MFSVFTCWKETFDKIKVVQDFAPTQNAMQVGSPCTFVTEIFLKPLVCPPKAAPPTSHERSGHVHTESQER